jgi:hypothetical protein
MSDVLRINDHQFVTYSLSLGSNPDHTIFPQGFYKWSKLCRSSETILSNSLQSSQSEMADVVPEFTNRCARVPHIPHTLSPSPVISLPDRTNFQLSSLAVHVKVAPFPSAPIQTSQNAGETHIKVLITLYGWSVNFEINWLFITNKCT